MAGRRISARQPRRTPSRRGSWSYVRPPKPLVAVNRYLITVQAPPNGATVRSLTPTITVLPVSELSTPVDVQVEWRTQPPWYNPDTYTWIPSPTYVSEYLAAASDFPLEVTPPGPLSYTTWFFRARAGSKTLDLWSDWTASARYVDVNPILGSTTSYIEMNVGATGLEWAGAVAYLDLNVGVEQEDAAAAVLAYSDMNVGVDPKWKQTTSYSDMNVYPPTGEYLPAGYADMYVLVERPTPHIWWIRPEQGREGYVFHIFGHGFGQQVNEYDGSVWLGALECQVVRWVTVPQSATTPEEMRITRGSGLESDDITVEHGWITVVVPPGAVTALVRVVLEGI